MEYAVTDRLKREIIYWDHRAETLKAQERAGKQARLSSAKAAARALSFEPRDVSAERIGYDIESRDSTSGRLRFIEVKGRMADADTVTVIRNEILTALNKPEAFILAIVQVADGVARAPRYIREPFTREPDYGATSVNYRYGGHKRN